MLNAFIISTLSGLSTTLGALFIFVKIKQVNINKFITFSLSFSLSIMIGLSITELIPQSLFFYIQNNSPIECALLILTCGVTSYIILKVINISITKISNEKTLYKIGLLSTITLMLHNFPEGIVTFMSSYNDINLGIKIGIAIMLHNIPEGISIAVPIYYATNSKKKAVFYAFLSGLSEPLGALLTYLFLRNYITNILLYTSFLFVGIIMILLSINDLLPKALSYKEKIITLGLLCGIVLTTINSILF